MDQQVLVVRDADAATLFRSGARAIWINDQPSPFGPSEEAGSPAGVLCLDKGQPTLVPGDLYEANLVVGKPGPSGRIQLLALTERLEGQSREEAIRHWDEHMELAVKIHHKALSYRQYRFSRCLTPGAPDYTGLAVLSFASADELLTGLYRTEADVAVIEADVAEFVSRVVTFFCSEYGMAG